MTKLDNLPFDHCYAALGSAYFSPSRPTACADPYVVSINESALALIGLTQTETTHPDFAAYFSGNQALPGANPLAMLYAGHQFGHYVPQLGDGRAILLGQVRNADKTLWDIQLKGAGQTAYSRSADGRAVLRSTIREYLCSEAMQALGIPTTRALCIIGSDDEIYRETIETGAILTRLAPSHVRFGSFEVFYHRQDYARIKPLADYVITQFYPDLWDHTERYLTWFNQVIQRTAELMAQWQVVGFSHGVMNTDNMSILGLTLDYGPFGFLDRYNPGFVCNHSDHSGRYAFDQQPSIGLWNLSCLAQAILPLFDPEPELAVEQAKACLETYWPHYAKKYQQLMRSKLGLQSAQTNDGELVKTLLAMMAKAHADYTITFRQLANMLTGEPVHPSLTMLYHSDAFKHWLGDYQARLQQEPLTPRLRAQQMRQVNPVYILRNYMAETAIKQAENKDYTEVDRLLSLLQHPFEEQPEMSHYAEPPPSWAEKIQVSCSS